MFDFHISEKKKKNSLDHKSNDSVLFMKQIVMGDEKRIFTRMHNARNHEADKLEWH